MGFDDFLTLLRDTGNAIYNAFAWPGEYALLQLGNIAPDFAAYMSTPTNHTTAVVILVTDLLVPGDRAGDRSL